MSQQSISQFMKKNCHPRDENKENFKPQVIHEEVDQPIKKARKTPVQTGVAEKSSATKDVTSLRSLLEDRVKAHINKAKQTTHNHKPLVEVNLGMDMDSAKALLGDVPCKATKTKLTAAKLTESQILNVLPAVGKEFKIEYTGKTWRMAGDNRKAYNTVKFDSMDYKYDSAAALLTLKIKLQEVEFDLSKFIGL
jgi:hypothetical protein